MKLIAVLFLVLTTSAAIAQRAPRDPIIPQGPEKSAEHVELESMLPALQACNRQMDGAGYHAGFENCSKIRSHANALQAMVRDRQNAKDIEAVKAVKVPAK